MSAKRDGGKKRVAYYMQGKINSCHVIAFSTTLAQLDFLCVVLPENATYDFERRCPSLKLGLYSKTIVFSMVNRHLILFLRESTLSTVKGKILFTTI